LVEAVQEGSVVADLRARLTNPEDGLEATREKVSDAAGNESLAMRAVGVAQLQAWRDGVLRNANVWLSNFAADLGPVVPDVPGQVLGDEILAPLAPADALNASVVTFQETIRRSATELVAEMKRLLRNSDEAYEAMRRDLDDRLETEGVEEGHAHLAYLTSLRSQLDELEKLAGRFVELRAHLLGEAAAIQELVAEIESNRNELRKDRKQGCAEVNRSMPTFRCRIDPDAVTESLDVLLDRAKTGTHFQESTLAEVRADLDRSRLVHDAISLAMGESLDAAPPALASQLDITRRVVEREDSEQLRAYARLACCWPGDGLLIERKVDGAEFRALSEGLKALAIKEISFAASDRPAITDQPEDAVTPSAVFDNLVPTLRTQRRDRQFIVASHDANIVVASDMERIIVLKPDGDPRPGTLAEADIREDALILLEGGKVAFERRAARYKHM